MSLLTEADLSVDPVFIKRIKAALVRHAITAIEAETSGVGDSVKLARIVLQQPEFAALRTAQFAAAKGLTEAATDAVILSGIVNNWVVLARLLTAMLLLCVALPAVAQQRTIPPATVAGPFAAGAAEAGAPGDYRIIPLRDTLPPFTDTVKQADDLLFYSPTQPGPSLLVVSVINPYGSGAILDCYQWVWLPRGLTLTPAYLDNDKRQDLIGYNATTGEVVRWYRRSNALGGCW